MDADGGCRQEASGAQSYVLESQNADLMWVSLHPAC
jgi:hypothetical protein